MKKQFIFIAAFAMIASMTSCGTSIIDTASEAAQTATSAVTEASAAAEATAAAQTTEAAPAETAQAATAADNAAPAQEKPSEPDLTAQYLFGGFVATESGDLNLRITPDTNSDIVAKIPKGTQIDLYATGVRGWYLTTYDGHNGYVSADFVEEIPAYEDITSEYAKASNEYGFFSVTDPAETSVSVAALSGTWVQEGAPESKLVITQGSDIYNGDFIYYENGESSVSGYVKLEYSLTQSGDHEYWYTFYEYGGALWHGFGVSGEIPLNDIYADQQGAPHFIRTEH
ncbi:MAG: SH3 domain-containing protein [Ruminococcus sp.]|nr:SH3 domain-containing protein [Ruminococcus sp.]